MLPPSFGLISQSVPQEVNQSLRRYNGRTQQRLTLPLILTAPRPFSSRSVCLFSPFQALFETSRAVLSFSMRFLKIKKLVLSTHFTCQKGRESSSFSCYHLCSSKHHYFNLSQCLRQKKRMILRHYNGRSRPDLKHSHSAKPLGDHLPTFFPCLLSPDQALSKRTS